jgi:hypothetical protein
VTHPASSPDTCPRCRAARLRRWDELTGEEREVVRRLPASADFALDERARNSRWCRLCWFEESRPTMLPA